MKYYRGYISSSVIAISALLLLLFAVPAYAQKQTLTYDVYAGGMRVVEAVMEMDVRESRYDIVFSAYTRGLLGKIVPWTGTFESHGWVNKDHNLTPELHKSTTTWRKEQEILEYKFKKSGAFDSYNVTDHNQKTQRKKIDPALSQGTTDILTAALGVFQQVGKGGACEGEAEIFDGKRRFKQIFAHEDSVDLAASRYNIFEGKAAQCIVEVQPMAGAWHKKPRGWMSIQEQGRERDTMPTVWTASIADGKPAVPVKVRIKTEHGTMFMHLTKYHSDKTVLVAKNHSK